MESSRLITGIVLIVLGVILFIVSIFVLPVIIYGIILLIIGILILVNAGDEEKIEGIKNRDKYKKQKG